ncbi:glycosyltransferase family 4 protein [Planctomycetota bacterium]
MLFVASQFPAYDETFLMREMAAVREAGLDIEIFSLKSCRDKIVHRQASELEVVTFYAPFFSPKIIWANLCMLLAKPVAFLALLWWLLAHCWSKPLLLLKSLALFPKSVFVARQLQHRQIKHVHALWATHPATAGVIMRRLGGGEVTFSFTGHAHDIYLDTTMLKDKMAIAEFVMTCTNDNKKYLAQFGKDEKIRVSYHGLDVAKYQPAEPEVTSEINIISVGSLLECKGFEYLIDAVGLLKESNNKVRCTIVGGGMLEDSLKRRARDRGVAGEVVFTGYVKQEDMPRYYQQAGVFVLPAIPEIHWGIPNVLLEAMACGVPILVTALPSIVEILQAGDVGDYIEERSAKSIAQKAQHILGDAEACRNMGLTARQKILRDFDIRKNGQRLAGWFQEYM